MKNNTVLFILAFLFILLACEKDKNDGTFLKNTHRIKEVLIDFDDDEFDQKTIFSYKNEKLVLWIDYRKDILGNWIISSKDTFTYAGENVTQTHYGYSTDYYLDWKSEYLINNNLVMQENRYTYDVITPWVEYLEYDYKYSGLNLTEATYQLDNNLDGIIDFQTKTIYTYLDGKVKEDIQYNFDTDWWPNFKETFEYSGDNLTSLSWWYIESLPDNWWEAVRTDFNYLNNRVSDIEVYQKDGADWRADYSNIYSYNANGYLISDTYPNYSYTFQYEEGHGNATLFYYSPQQYYNGEPKLK